MCPGISEFANKLTHPRHEVPKTYLVEVEGLLDNKTLRRLEKGVTLEDGPIKTDKLKLVQRASSRSLVQITLHSGRNRIVRRMMDAVGYPVRQLSRISVGPVKLGQLQAGQTRELTQTELGALLDIVEL